MKEDLEKSDISELPAVISALLDTLDDKNGDVKQSVIEAIHRISLSNPEAVMHTSVYFWELHRKISSEHMCALLKVMSDTCKHQAACLNADLASSVAELAVAELCGESEKEAAELLIALSKAHCTQAMGGLLTKLEPGVLPHPVIIHTIGMIAVNNPFGMVSFFKIILTIILPMLMQTKDDILKQEFCFTLGKFSEAINDYIMNAEDASPEISKETYKEEINSAFETLTYTWLRTSRDNKLTEAILMALAPMIPLLPEEIDGDRMSKVTHLLLNFCRKPHTRLAAIRVLSEILSNATNNDKEVLRQFLDQIHQILSELVSISPFDVSRDALLTHYEVLKCSRSLVVLYPEEGLDRILQQLKSPVATQKTRALVVLRHLINTLPQEDDATLHRIALSLQDALGENGALQMVGAIVALAARPTLPLLPSQRAIFVRYMVTHCGIKNDETEAYADALHLLATTVEGAETWLWPCLIRSLLDITYSASASAILRALTPLTTKIMRSNNSTLQSEFPGTKVLARCLELLGQAQNRVAVITFLKPAAPLLGHQLKTYWDEKLLELAQYLQDEQRNDARIASHRNLHWEEHVVEFLEESVKLEGNVWGYKLADELSAKASAPHVAPFLACLCNNNSHIALLVELARNNGATEEFARAVGVSSKRYLTEVLKLMEESCTIEDTRKLPVRLLGLVKDTKAAATAEAAKSGLLRSYAEICQKADAEKLFPSLEKHILPWIVKQLNDCKELTAKEAGLLALEHVANAVHVNRLPSCTGLRGKETALATLLAILQSSSGYRPLQLYPAILKAAVSLVCVPPALASKEREVLLGTVLDKVICASSEIILLLKPEIMHQIIDELGILCSEIVVDSADALAELVDILLPWMQSKSNIERKTTLLVLRTTLKSYYNSLKYTYPGGKLETGRLIGRVLSWCADPEIALRSLVVDCVILSLKIGTRHRSLSPDSHLEKNLDSTKAIIVNEDPNVFYEGIKTLAGAVSERLPNGEIISLAEGLIEGLLFRGEAGVAAGIALSQHFKIKGAEISGSDVCLVGNIITQMRHMENSSCRHRAAVAIKSLMSHHSEEVLEHLLMQPLPLDRGSEECWKELGASDELGPLTLDLLLTRLENNNLLSDNVTSPHSEKHTEKNTASFSSLAAIIALSHLLQAPSAENLIERRMAGLLSALLKYLSGWLYVEAPVSVVNTKFGYVPNREASKINPHAEVYAVLTDVLTVIDSNVASSLLNRNVFDSETQAEESVVSTVRTMIRCISNRNDVLSSLAQTLGKLITSTLSAQRAVATAFYAELIGKVDCGAIWLDAIINTLHEAKSDSSPLVRKLATIGLAKIAYLEPKQIDEYFDNCMEALLDGLEEPANGEGGNEVVIESLRGLTVLFSIQFKRSISPRVILALKPFVEKENWEMRLTAISALGAVAYNWQRSVKMPDNDITDHLLGCIPCLTMRLEDSNVTIAKTAQDTFCKAASLLQCERLSKIIYARLGPKGVFDIESFLCELISCLTEELPQRADELRNAVVRGYSRSENNYTRATAALILGILSSPTPDVLQRLLQLLRDQESMVKIRAARALSLCFTR